MPMPTATPDLLRAGQRLLWFLLLSSTLGCSHERHSSQEGLAERILPPLTIDLREEHPAVGPVSNRPDGHEAGPKPAPQGETAPGTAGASRDGPGQPKPANDAGRQVVTLPEPAQAREVIGEPGQTLTLAQAIDIAVRQQPRLRVYLESVEQARRAEDIAFAPFLPVAAAGYSVGGFDVNAGGLGVLVGTPSAFTFIPALGAVPIGLNIDTGFELADLKLQWLICDFGRRLGRYRQAGLAADIAQLQTERAYQTVANEVAVAYYQ
ncbi:MAG TPA: TolC family protein, partial [Gemmataceae bacterium]|nr:TolC family protein [Gemmataceae bacterium]